jgi:hypothetical protein
VAKDPPDELASSVLLLALPQIGRARADGHRAIVFMPLLRPTPGRQAVPLGFAVLATVPEGSTTRARVLPRDLAPLRGNITVSREAGKIGPQPTTREPRS